MKLENPMFVGTEASLYAVTPIIGKNCLNNIDAFAAVDAGYTPQFVQDLLNSSEAARLLPNNHQRQSITTKVYTAACGAADACCSKFMQFMFYVGRSFPADSVETKKKMAGGEYYEEARSYKWTAVSTMNPMMTSFIGSNSAALLAGGMQEDFPATCDTTNAAFVTALGAYNDNKTVMKAQTAAKTSANNAVYARVMSLCNVGKFIAGDNALLREQFTYSAVLNSTRKPGPTGFRFAVTDEADKDPIENAHLSFTNSKVTATTDEDGIIKIEMPDGEYSFIMTATGYTTIIGKVKTKKGTMRHPKIKMKAGSGVVDTTPVPKKAIKEKAAL